MFIYNIRILLNLLCISFYVYLVDDLIQKLEDKFRILRGEHDNSPKFKVFERELSVSLQDVFYRELAADGNTISHNLMSKNLKYILS